MARRTTTGGCPLRFAPRPPRARERGARMETLSRFTYETIVILAVGDAFMRPARRSTGRGLCSVGAAPPRGRPTIREPPVFRKGSHRRRRVVPERPLRIVAPLRGAALPAPAGCNFRARRLGCPATGPPLPTLRNERRENRMDAHRRPSPRARAGGGGGAGDGRTPPHHLLAGALHHESVSVGRHEGDRGRLARAGAPRALRPERRHAPLARRARPHARERRRLGGPAERHLEAQARPRMERRDARHRARRRLHLAILHPPRGRLRPAREIQRREKRGGARRADDPRHLRGAQALPLRAVRGRAGAHPPGGAVRRLPRGEGARLHRGEFPAGGHGAVQGLRIPPERRRLPRRQPPLPRPGEARLRLDSLQGRGRRGRRRARGARNRRVRLRLEPPARPGSAGEHGEGGEGAGGLRVRHAGRAHRP